MTNDQNNGTQQNDMLLGLLQSYEAEGQYARVLKMLTTSPAEGAEYEALKQRCEFAISRQQGDLIDNALKAGNHEAAAKALAELRDAVGETTIVKAFAALIGPTQPIADSPTPPQPARETNQPAPISKVEKAEPAADNTHNEPMEDQLPPPSPNSKYPFTENISFVGGLGYGPAGKSGRFTLYNEEVLFRPFIVNFGSTQDRRFPIKDIIKYHHAMMGMASFKLKDGTIVRINLVKKNRFLQEVEARRQYYYTSRGLPVPELES